MTILRGKGNRGKMGGLVTILLRKRKTRYQKEEREKNNLETGRGKGKE